MAKLREKFDLWLDQAKMAILGAQMTLRQPKYLLVAVFSCLVFAYFLTMFRSGTASWNMLWSGLGFSDKIAVLLDVWGSVLANFTHLEGLLLMALTILQGIVIALLVLVWRNRDKKAAATGLEASGVGVVLGFLAVGCPSCGISLLAPILTAIAGTSALVLADTLGWVFMFAAFILLLVAIRKMGYSAFIILTARRKRKNAKN